MSCCEDLTADLWHVSGCDENGACQCGGGGGDFDTTNIWGEPACVPSKVVPVLASLTLACGMLGLILCIRILTGSCCKRKPRTATIHVKTAPSSPRLSTVSSAEMGPNARSSRDSRSFTPSPTRLSHASRNSLIMPVIEGDVGHGRSSIPKRVSRRTSPSGFTDIKQFTCGALGLHLLYSLIAILLLVDVPLQDIFFLTALAQGAIMSRVTCLIKVWLRLLPDVILKSGVGSASLRRLVVVREWVTKYSKGLSIVMVGTSLINALICCWSIEAAFVMLVIQSAVTVGTSCCIICISATSATTVYTCMIGELEHSADRVTGKKNTQVAAENAKAVYTRMIKLTKMMALLNTNSFILFGIGFPLAMVIPFLRRFIFHNIEVVFLPFVLISVQLSLCVIHTFVVVS